jgi:hypothetical protein
MDVTSVDVGRQLPPILAVAALKHHRSIGQQKADPGSVRGLVSELRYRLRL